MAAKLIDVYLEVGAKRVFAGAIEWPGWCRSGKTAEDALEALLECAPRYANAVGKAGGPFTAPKSIDAFKIVEKLKGDATTDFGAPGIAPKADSRALGRKELSRQQELLEASWAAVDRAATAANRETLSVGPRGGGRKLDAITQHVDDADGAYLRAMGGKPGSAETKALRKQFLETVAARAGGEEPTPGPRKKKPFWTPRYAVRRSAWHALDHAWEIEDRSSPSPNKAKRAPG
ncbi:MAG: hypothetical protein WEB06_13935 [Actinomycetota bacterium]